MALFNVFCRHQWGFPMHGKYTCLKCGRERITEAIAYDAEHDRMRLQSAKLELQRELASHQGKSKSAQA